MLSDLMKNPRFNLLGALLIVELICSPGASGQVQFLSPYGKILSGISEISLGITILALTFLVVKSILRKGGEPT